MKKQVYDHDSAHDSAHVGAHDGTKLALSRHYAGLKSNSSLTQVGPKFALVSP